MVEIIWSPRAVHDLEGIHSYIAIDSQKAASWTVAQILQAVSNLRAFPKIGRIIPEIGCESSREIFYRSYRIMYNLTDCRVEIVTIYHGAREFGDHGG